MAFYNHQILSVMYIVLIEILLRWILAISSAQYRVKNIHMHHVARSSGRLGQSWGELGHYVRVAFCYRIGLILINIFFIKIRSLK